MTSGPIKVWRWFSRLSQPFMRCDSRHSKGKVNCECVHLHEAIWGRTMITQFRIQNYKALRDVTLDLTPIHVLIGPNDSGKTSILEAIAAMCRSVDHILGEAFAGSWDGHQLVWRGS